MKILKKVISEKDGVGFVLLRPEDSEDMWHLYNLIHVHDTVQTTTFRKVVKEGVTGSTSSTKIRLKLEIGVEKLEFDSHQCLLRVQGRNITENAHVKMGAYHTLDLEMNRDFKLSKDRWDTMTLERLEECSNVSKSADVAAVVMQTGLAHVCLIKGHMTVVRSKIDVSIPRKGRTGSSHEKAVKKFYDAVMNAVLRHIDFSIVKVVLVASPGFVKDDFLKYMMEVAVQRDEKSLLENKSKFLLVHSSSGHKHALDEVLQGPKIQGQLQDTKAVEDVKALDSFFEMMHHDQDRAYYGYNHVVAADEQLAIETLLITDSLFRSDDLQTRIKYVKLVESVREHGGIVRLFSSMHVSGEKLGQVSGIAAILRFPLPDIDEEDDSEEDE